MANLEVKNQIIQLYKTNRAKYDDASKSIKKYRAEFLNDFGPDKLKNMKPADLLNRLCFQNGNMDDMMHRLEYDDNLTRFFGNIQGNPKAKLGYLISKDNNQWHYWKKNPTDAKKLASDTIDINKARKIAEKIRDFLVFASDEIESNELKTVEEYKKLGTTFQNKCNKLGLPEKFYEQIWIRKYLRIVHINKMSSWYAKDYFKRAFDMLGLTWHDDIYATVGEVAVFARECKVPLGIFETIVGADIGLPDKENSMTTIGNKKTRGNNMPETNSSQIPLNQILYGAPGTGKTYSTIIKAMEILENDGGDYGFNISKERYDELHGKFNDLKKQGRVEFVTFHQSMSYEDFVEGIRPVLDNETSLGYRRVDGIFKKIAERANAKADHQKYSKKEIPANARIFKMSLGSGIENAVFEFCMENSVIANNYGGDIDFSNAKNRRDVEKLVKDNKLDNFARTAMNFLRCEMKPGDIVLIANGNSEIVAIAEITGDYVFNPEADIEYKHFRNVNWISHETIPVSAIVKGKKFSMKSVYELKDIDIKVLNSLITGDAPQNKNYVLVIDEINRGNISKIFGELITLIESTKRIGAEEELTITLPYSQESFGVPQNLYIIGTMNTADRSIAAIDIALRRRFKFIPVLPDANLIDQEIDGIKVRAVFEKLNNKINALLDEDHLIGHSFFKKCNSVQMLKDVWFNEIMPLMKEYFWGDWDKLKIVLGNDFVIKRNIADKSVKNLISEDEFWQFEKIENFDNNRFVEAINKLAEQTEQAE